MLRSVCFKNFVQFEEYQMLDFSSRGPFIFIGENCSGKSSVFEGIRRCLKLEYSSSISSVFDPNKPSYFICNFEKGNSEDIKIHIISGIASLPPTHQSFDNKLRDNYNPSRNGKRRRKSSTTNVTSIPKENRQREFSLKNGKDERVEETLTNTDILHSKETFQASSEESVKDIIYSDYHATRFYKFTINCDGNEPMYISLVDKSEDGRSLQICKTYKISHIENDTVLKQFKNTILKQRSDRNSIDDHMDAIFKCIDEGHEETSGELHSILNWLTEDLVFTFPLRSIGPLQWSESVRIAGEYRDENYTEAERRCQIIKYFLEDNGEKFDKNKEQEYFQQLTQIDDYHFTLKDGKITLPKGKFALLKTPEGILEAKAFCILLSSKQYKTLLLDEPDRGMHPQFIARMIQLMNQEKNKKRVILSTHQKEFVSPWTVTDTFIFRRSGTKHFIISGKYILGVEKDVSMKDIRLSAAHNITDIFFARKVLFYEGAAEELFLGELKRQILTNERDTTSELFDGDEVTRKEASKRLKNSLLEYTLIRMNGEGLSEFYHSISEKLRLDHLFLLDKDKVETVKHGRIFYWKDGTIESMVIAMCKEDDKLRKALADQKVLTLDISQGTFHIKWRKGKNKGKLFLDKRINSSNVTESVRLLLQHCKKTHDLAAFFKKLIE